VQSYKDKKLDSLPGYTSKETLEMEIMAELEGARTMAAQGTQQEHRPRKQRTQLMAIVKARGNILNFVQTSMLLGQQAVRGKRPSRGYNGQGAYRTSRETTRTPSGKGLCNHHSFAQD
jgi:DNA-directed RNA polymerase beta' subunit